MVMANAKPLTGNDQQIIVRNAEPMVDKFKSVLQRLRDESRRRIGGQKTGRIHSSSLYKTAVGIDSVFSKRVKLQGVGGAVCVLEDASGSIQHEQWVGILGPMTEGLCQAGKGIREIEIYAVCYTSNGPTTVDVMFRPGWTRVLHGGHRDGGTPASIALVGAGLLLKKSKMIRRVVVHITDGAPDNYETFKKAREDLLKSGIGTVTIIIGNSRRENPYWDEGFGKGLWRAVGRMEEVPDALEKLIAEVLR